MAKELPVTMALENTCYNQPMTGQTATEDLALVRGVLAGDENAAEELVRKYQKRIFTLAYRMVHDMEEAKDLTQKVFINAVRGLKGFRHESSFKTWLYTIAMNLCINEKRKDRHIYTELDDSIASHEKCSLAAIVDGEERMLLRKEINDLPKRQRKTLLLRVYAGLSCSETAEVMNCSEGAVKAQYHHAVKRLRTMIRGNTEDET